MSELGALIELLGEEVTLKLVEAYAGTRRGVPKLLPEKHELRELLGDEGFARLHQYFGGSEIKVPMAKRWRFEIYRKNALKTKQIAQRLGLTERRVTQMMGEDEGARKQLSLF